MKDELGISLIINPERATAEEIVNMINIPSVLKLEKFAKGKVNLVEILHEKGNPLIGETLITMQKVVKTKVLMLSATPVNNRFNDLKNQLQEYYSQ